MPLKYLARFVLVHPSESRPSLLVAVVQDATAEVLELVRQQMFARGCANGLVIDPQHVKVLRDTYDSMYADAIREEMEGMATSDLVGAEGDLSSRVHAWLRQLTSNWRQAVPPEQWAAELLYDVVPAASGSLVVEEGRG